MKTSKNARPQWSTAIGLAAVLVWAVTTSAQQESGPSGLPDDWSHHRLVFSNAGTYVQMLNPRVSQDAWLTWNALQQDPRARLQARKRAKKELEDAAAEIALAADNQMLPVRAAGGTGKKKPPVPGQAIHRDWSNVMGGVAGVGDTRTYPAKFNFKTTSKSCSSDFVVFTTSTAGATSSVTGVFYTQVGTFTGVPLAGETISITNTTYAPAQVLTLTADASVNTGLKFAVGATAADAATNLANAIARNGGTVGMTATAAVAAVTLNSITKAVPNGDINTTEGLSNFTLAAEVAGSGTAGQPTIFALNQLYADTIANGGCQTSTQAVPATYWSYNTGTGAIADLSPVLSYYDNGAQVAFVQKAGSVATLVLLKWSSTSSVGTIGAPTALATQTAANYRTCTAPCMLTLTFNNGSPNVNDTNSAPFVDYTNDILYVGDDVGKLHKFTGVFQGTPAEVTTSPWPVAVGGATSVMSSPVYDSVSGLIFVGSGGNDSTSGNKLHSVNASSGAVVSAGTLGSTAAATKNGVVDAPLVDSTAQRVYAFVGSGNTLTDSLGNTCSTPSCAAIYQFDTASSLATQNTGLGAGLGTKVFVGISDDNNDFNRSLNAGAFDDAYYSSANPASPSGSLYVCGHPTVTVNRPGQLWKINITGNTITSRTQGPLLVSANNDDGCSPTTVFKNGSAEYLYVSVRSNAAALGGGACTQASGCTYMVQLPMSPSFGSITSANSTVDSTARFGSVSAGGVALNATEATVATTLTASTAGTYFGMSITANASAAGTVFTYTLRKNAGDTAITCSTASGGATCSDLTHSVSFAAGDTIDVKAVSTSGGGTLAGKTVAVQLGAVNAAINASGGTGGIIIDNTLAGGGSQIYYSTRANPGIAVQTSQAGLQ